MESNTKLDRKTVIKSTLFITGFWSLTALLFLGLFKLFDTIDISAAITSMANDMKSFRAVIETSVGSVFYSWIFGFGGKVVIKSPEDVKDEYSSMVLNAGKSLGLFEYGESEKQTV